MDKHTSAVFAWLIATDPELQKRLIRHYVKDLTSRAKDLGLLEEE